jgi:hypothetical protein
MVIRNVPSRIVSFQIIAGLALFLIHFGQATAASGAVPSISHHDLFVQIDPATHSLIAEDRLRINVLEEQAIQLNLAPTLIVDRVMLLKTQRGGADNGKDIPFEVTHASGTQPSQQLIIPAASMPAGTIEVALSYHGLINDPPKEPRHLRFVTPSETAGHIGPEGVYLSSETRWYPDLPESLSTYKLQAALPDGWTAVTQGRPRSTGPCPIERCRQSGFAMTVWPETRLSEALTLVANRFVGATRDWRAGTGQSIQLAAYLFPEDAALADEYLDATARYLDAYIPLLGPYPFDTFAVVENFFSSGLGMPTFTLLGSGIIKRHYVQPYALGHEIVHSWIGNFVYNRPDRGNWVEGLTTYLANYYWHERSNDLAQARDQRKLFLRGYNLHVPIERDYPITQFTQKQDERDNAIGYQKAAMVFHILRQEIGEDGFWSALRSLVTQFGGRHAEWRDVERLMSETAGRDLRWFFAQWIEGTGAPSLALKRATVMRTPGKAPQTFELLAEIEQTGKLFDIPVHLLIDLEDGRQLTQLVRIKGARERVVLTVPLSPRRIALDPDSMLLQRIPRRTFPPLLNHYVTDPRRSVIDALGSGRTVPHPLRDVVSRVEAQESRKPLGERTTIEEIADTTLLPKEGSVLVLGTPQSSQAIESLVRPHCGERLALLDNGVVLDGAAYEGEGIAVLVTCRRRDQPDSVLSLVYAVTPQAASTVARLLFFYGWHSYVLFKDGAAAARGEWAVPGNEMEVLIHE